MGTGHGYGHAGKLLELHGQEKRKATLAKKKREKACADFDPHVWIEGSSDESFNRAEYKGLLFYVCPYCAGVERSSKPHIHRHPEDDEAFEVELHGMLWQPVGVAKDYPGAKPKKRRKK